MPDLATIRQQYPQYGDMSDQQLADALHQKFYADMAPDEFYQKIGLQTAPPPDPAPWSAQRTGDIAARMLQFIPGGETLGALAHSAIDGGGLAQNRAMLEARADEAHRLAQHLQQDPSSAYSHIPLVSHFNPDTILGLAASAPEYAALAEAYAPAASTGLLAKLGGATLQGAKIGGTAAALDVKPEQVHGVGDVAEPVAVGGVLGALLGGGLSAVGSGVRSLGNAAKGAYELFTAGSQPERLAAEALQGEAPAAARTKLATDLMQDVRGRTLPLEKELSPAEISQDPRLIMMRDALSRGEAAPEFAAGQMRRGQIMQNLILGRPEDAPPVDAQTVADALLANSARKIPQPEALDEAGRKGIGASLNKWDEWRITPWDAKKLSAAVNDFVDNAYHGNDAIVDPSLKIAQSKLAAAAKTGDMPIEDLYGIRQTFTKPRTFAAIESDPRSMRNVGNVKSMIDALLPDDLNAGIARFAEAAQKTSLLDDFKSQAFGTTDKFNVAKAANYLTDNLDKLNRQNLLEPLREEARNQAIKHMTDKYIDEAGNFKQGLSDYIGQNSEKLSVLFNDKTHLNNLKRIASFIEEQRTGRNIGVSPSQGRSYTSQGVKQNVDALETIIKKALSAKFGGVGGFVAHAATERITGNLQAETNKIMWQALNNDPQLLAKLLTKSMPADKIIALASNAGDKTLRGLFQGAMAGYAGGIHYAMNEPANDNKTKPMLPAPRAAAKPVDSTEALVEKLKPAVSFAESSGRTNAVNPKAVAGGQHAVGEFQFLPSTADAINKQLGTNYDPTTKEGGEALFRAYMKQLLTKHKGDVRAALAEYGGFKTADPTDYVEKILTKAGMA